MKAIIILILSCSLIMVSSSVQSTSPIFEIPDISFVGGSIKFIEVNVTNDKNAVMYLDITVLPDEEGFNLTYPESIDLSANQKTSFYLIVRTSLYLATGSCTVSIKYQLEYEEDIPSSNDNGGDSPPNFQYGFINNNPEPDPSSPVIHPKPDRPHNPYVPPPEPDPEMDKGLYYTSLLLIASLIISIIVLYLSNRRKKNKK